MGKISGDLHQSQFDLMFRGSNEHNVTVFLCLSSSRVLDCVPLTIKLNSHYKADYITLRGTLTSVTDSDCLCVLIIRRIEPVVREI